MIEIISGEKGKGKTKELLNKVNTSITSATGNIVYLDKSQKHMYELNNKIRLINVNDFLIDNCDEFLGFICGVISQDHDLEEMYLKKQIERMKSGSCNAEAGILFSELLTDFERIGDHVLNIAEQYQNMAR